MLKFDPYRPDDLDPDLPLVQGLSPLEYKIVNHQYQQMASRYGRAVEELDMTFYKLKQVLDQTTGHTVIQRINSRVKTAPSMCEKILRLKKPCTIDSIQKNLFDIAGLRIVCSYIDDIYDVLAWMQRCPDFEIVQIKDYVKNPKPSGYRSVHVIFSMTIYDCGALYPVTCEVQLRTGSMHAWSALEHQLQYKTKGLVPDEIRQDLVDCAEMMHQTDLRMQEIFQKLNHAVEHPEDWPVSTSSPLPPSNHE